MPKKVAGEEPKYFVGCAESISTSMARNIAEDKARHGARKATCGDDSTAIVSGRIVGYLNEGLVEKCEDDPENEACEYYQEFKKLLGEDGLPEGKKTCALFRADTIECQIKPSKDK